MNEGALEISDRLRKFKSELEGLREEITFNEYLEKVLDNPKLASLAHERLFNMIHYFGVDENGEFNLFAKELFGLKDQLKAVVDYFKSSGDYIIALPSLRLSMFGKAV